MNFDSRVFTSSSQACTFPQSPVLYLLSSIPHQSTLTLAKDRQLKYLFLPLEPSSEKACLSLGDPSDKVTIQLKLILFARLVAFFGRPVEEKSASIRIFRARSSRTSAIKLQVI